MGWCGVIGREIIKEEYRTVSQKEVKSKAFITFLALLMIIDITIVLVYPLSQFIIAATCEQWVAKVVSVQGSVQVKRAGETQWQPVN